MLTSFSLPRPKVCLVRLGLLFLLVPGVAAARVIRVAPGAPGVADGTSWADAYTDLQPALLAAGPGDELWVAAGVYVPGATADESVTFQLRNGVALYGGFAGGETDRLQRDWLVHPTVLSGDVGRDDVYGNPWYVNWNIHTANSAHVVTGSGTDGTALLDGFTVEAGHTGPVGTPAGTSSMLGGGLYNVAGSPTIRNCTFRRIVAAFGPGAAVYNMDSSPVLDHCTFRENWVHLGSGGGVFSTGASQPQVRDCLFEYNRVTSGSGGNEAQGAAIAYDFSCPAQVVERCVFRENLATQFSPGSGIETPRGGGISCQAAAITIRDCRFEHNQAAAGGAVFVWGDATLINCLFWNNVAFKIVIQSTSGGGYGGAFVNQAYVNRNVQLINCTAVGNAAGEAAIYGLGTNKVRLDNCIVWGNSASGEGLPPVQANIKGAVALRYSLVGYLFEPIPGEDPPDSTKYPGCTQGDPLLVNPASGNCELQAGSPAIDHGHNGYLPVGVETDLLGATRVVSGGLGVVVDMGAFEHGAAVSGLPGGGSPARNARPFLSLASNPFRSMATLQFELEQSVPVRLDVFDAAGRLVRRFDAGWLPAGPHRMSWDGRREAGDAAPAGVYFFRLSAGTMTATSRGLRLR